MPLDPAKIKARREKLKLSQTEAAARAGIALPNWHRTESGERVDPRFSTAEKIADALRCPLDALR